MASAGYQAERAGPPMRRQTVLALLGAALVFAAPVSSLSAEKLVGVLYRGGDYTKQLDGLREGLRGAGLTIGAHLRLEIREVKGDFRAAQESARGLERMSADVLVTFGVSLALAAQQSTSTVPIVFTTGSDPMALGLIQSVNRPGGRVTGISSFSTEATAKRLGILRELIPTLNRVVAFYEPTNPASREGIQNLREVSTAAQC